jgi:hypothetical protein
VVVELRVELRMEGGKAWLRIVRDCGGVVVVASLLFERMYGFQVGGLADGRQVTLFLLRGFRIVVVVVPVFR